MNHQQHLHHPSLLTASPHHLTINHHHLTTNHSQLISINSQPLNCLETRRVVGAMGAMQVGEGPWVCMFSDTGIAIGGLAY